MEAFCSCSSRVVGKWAVEQLKENRVPGDQGLVLKSRAKHHAIAAMLSKPFVFKDEPLVVQWVLPCFSLCCSKWLQYKFNNMQNNVPFCDLVADTRWIFKMVSTVVAPTSNCFRTLTASAWWVKLHLIPLKRILLTFKMKTSPFFALRSSFKIVHRTPSCLDQTSVGRTTSCTSSYVTRTHWTKTGKRNMPRGLMWISRSSTQTGRPTSTLWVHQRFKTVFSLSFIRLCLFLKCTFSRCQFWIQTTAMKCSLTSPVWAMAASCMMWCLLSTHPKR